jgi:hypothetical protein
MQVIVINTDQENTSGNPIEVHLSQLNHADRLIRLEKLKLYLKLNEIPRYKGAYCHNDYHVYQRFLELGKLYTAKLLMGVYNYTLSEATNKINTAIKKYG